MGVAAQQLLLEARPSTRWPRRPGVPMGTLKPGQPSCGGEETAPGTRGEALPGAGTPFDDLILFVSDIRPW